MNYPKEIETCRIEIARLTCLIRETRDRVRLIEAKEALALGSEVADRLHSRAVIVRLEAVNEYMGLLKTLRNSRTERSILKAQLERKRSEFDLELLRLRSEAKQIEAGQQELFV